ncbi:MAG: DUF3105 domain-containing protein [Leptospirillia bacterium]
MYQSNTKLAATLIALLFLGAWGCSATRPHVEAPEPGPVLTQYPDQGHDHLPHPDFPHPPYASNPPTSGPHTPYTTHWGMHERPLRWEVALHNMEHGGIVAAYRCSPCKQMVATLTELHGVYPMMIIAHEPNLDAPLVFAAWRHTLSVPRLDEPGWRAIKAFFDEHYAVDHHPMSGSHPHSAAPTDP